MWSRVYKDVTELFWNFIFQSKMDELDLFRGDSVLLKGKQTKETVCIVLSDNNVTNNEIAMNRCIRKNLSIEIGDSVR